MRLNFLVDKKYTFLHAFSSRQPKAPFREWSDFILAQQKRYPQECFLLRGSAEWSILDKISLKSLADKTESLFKEWREAPESKRLINETQGYRDWLQKEWHKKGDIALRILKDITRIPLTNKKISVYVTHPKLYNGLNLPEKNIICWGHPEDWKDYSVVYLCHEILHILTYKKFNDVKIIHALIELAADNELRIRLHKKGDYFRENSYEVGHPSLRNLERKILPLWKEYLSGIDDSKNILELEKKIFKSKGLIV